MTDVDMTLTWDNNPLKFDDEFLKLIRRVFKKYKPEDLFVREITIKDVEDKLKREGR